MADVSSQASTSEVTYRPLSALAVVGFAVSCLFAGMVAVSAGVAIKQGAPFFFPGWTLLIAVAGFILSYSGVNDIRNAEGTKAGARLASWGMGLSLVCGLGYFAYYYSTRLALTQQANEFLTVLDDESGFLPLLQKGAEDKSALHRAFLLTLPAFDRAGVRPEDEAALVRLHDMHGPDGTPGKLSQFKQNQLVTRLVQAGDEAKIEPKGIKDWVYENRSYQVSRTYRIQTKEATTDVVLVVKSSEGDAEGQTRSWFVDLRNSYPEDSTLTEFGVGLRKLRGQATGVLHRFSQSLQRPDKVKGPDIDLAKIDRTDWSKVHVEQTFRDDVKMRVLRVFEGGAAPDRWQVKLSPDVGGLLWSRDSEGRISVEVPAQVTLGGVGGAQSQQLGADVLFTVRTKGAADPEAIAAIENQSDMPEFELIEIRFTQAYPFIRQ